VSPLQRGLAAFRQRLEGTQEWKIADRALTLHMLRGLAPTFFAQQGLQIEWELALRDMRSVPASFPPELSLDQAMSRLDALYLLRLHGQPMPPFEGTQLANFIEAIDSPTGDLAAWLMGEQARLLGVTAGPRWSERFPFIESDWLLHLYFVTHLFMLDSDYFARPVSASTHSEELAHLERALPPLRQGRRWDLLGEAQLCLAACGRADPSTHEALIEAQRFDGSWAESGHHTRQTAHTTCSCLVALAAAQEASANASRLRERERPAPAAGL
jgi:D-amino peptidase